MAADNIPNSIPSQSNHPIDEESLPASGKLPQKNFTSTQSHEASSSSKNIKVCVLGGGSFGTAIANIAAENGHPTSLWMRNSEAVACILEDRENRRYLPGLKLSSNLEPTDQLKKAVEGARLVFVAIPSKSFRGVVQNAAMLLRPDQYVISTTKGIEPGTFNLMSQVLSSELPNNSLGVLSGPNLAKEIAQHQLTASVIASHNEDLRSMVQGVLGCGYFRVYANVDVYGVELGGALKNIYAIISGLATSMNMGENTKSMIMTRSLAEMSRFAVSQGANPMTFLGLAGVGDLFVTCTSSLSRNFRVGFALGQGKGLEAAVAELGEVAEGVNTLLQVKEKADRESIYMPLVQGLYCILYEDKPVAEVIQRLMLAEQSSDVEFILPRDQVGNQRK